MFSKLIARLKRVFANDRGTSVISRAQTSFIFAIPVAPFVDQKQWDHLNELLLATLRSALNQSNANFRILVAGHERPEALDQVGDDRVEFVPVAFPKPSDPRSRRQDKRRKRWAIAARFRQMGGGYFMYLDADDYVHRDLVQFVLDDDNKSGYFIPEGYALDYKNGVLATIPGAWRKPFNHVCGSSGIVYFRPQDLPKAPYPVQRLATQPYFKYRNHLSFQDVSLTDRPNTAIPFRAAIYVVNNDINLSNVIVRTPERQERLIAGIKKRRIEDDSAILQQFGVRKLSAGEPAGMER